MSSPFYIFKPPSLRSEEVAEAKRLYEWVKARHHAIGSGNIYERIGSRIIEELPPTPEYLNQVVVATVIAILAKEPYLEDLPEMNFEKMNMEELVRQRNVLIMKQHFLQNQEAVTDLLVEGLVGIITHLCMHLPAGAEPSPFTIPLMNALPDAAGSIDFISYWFRKEEFQRNWVFNPTRETLNDDIARASGWVPGKDKIKLIPAKESKLPLNELPKVYLKGTPFEHFLADVSVPLKLTHVERFNHMHVVGGTGAGKTSLLEHLILNDIQSEDPPSIVLIDPHGDLIRRLTHADLGIQDRLIMIDPRDIQHPPALNVFAVNRERLGRYDEATREQVTAGVIQTFNYLFSGLTDLQLTGKQEVFFRYVARLMLALPDAIGRNATILDMLAIMGEKPPEWFDRAVQHLTPIQKEFFATDFRGNTFKETKNQIRYRLQGIIENPTMARLFTSPETKVDIFTELNRGSIILVDTAKEFLKDASGDFGRLFISLVLQAVLERAALPENSRKSTFLYIDEAASYFDNNIDDLLTDARKYRAGIVLAHQYLDQGTSALRASLAANTGIKMASGVSAADARQMANEMRTTPDFILGQPKLQFASYIRNTTPQAVSVPIRPGAIASLPKLSEEQYDAMIERNRRRVSSRHTAAAEEPSYPMAAEPDAPFTGTPSGMPKSW